MEKKKILEQEKPFKVLYPAKTSFRNEGRIKTFSSKGKLKEFIAKRFFRRDVKGSSSGW